MIGFSQDIIYISSDCFLSGTECGILKSSGLIFLYWPFQHLRKDPSLLKQSSLQWVKCKLKDTLAKMLKVQQRRIWRQVVRSRIICQSCRVCWEANYVRGLLGPGRGMLPSPWPHKKRIWALGEESMWKVRYCSLSRFLSFNIPGGTSCFCVGWDHGDSSCRTVGPLNESHAPSSH